MDITIGTQRTSAHGLTVAGTRFHLNGAPFPYTGLSFFNAIYNADFNSSHVQRRAWLEKFRRYGINVLRVWAQWDNARGFVDSGPDRTLYRPDGSLVEEHVRVLQDIIADADEIGMVVLFVLFQNESWREGIRLAPDAADKAVADLTQRLRPYRNLAFQVWNENDDRTLEHVATIKQHDPLRLVTNSPGGAGVLGTPRENATLDFLTPHTSRHGGRHWEVAPREIAMLLARYGKPVVDDEPARTGTRSFGGPTDATVPTDHMLQIYNVWQTGGYVTYHHDMFQTGQRSPAVPPSGVPDPEFSPYHHEVFTFLARRERYMP